MLCCAVLCRTACAASAVVHRTPRDLLELRLCGVLSCGLRWWLYYYAQRGSWARFLLLVQSRALTLSSRLSAWKKRGVGSASWRRGDEPGGAVDPKHVRGTRPLHSATLATAGVAPAPPNINIQCRVHRVSVSRSLLGLSTMALCFSA